MCCIKSNGFLDLRSDVAPKSGYKTYKIFSLLVVQQTTTSSIHQLSKLSGVNLSVSG